MWTNITDDEIAKVDDDTTAAGEEMGAPPMPDMPSGKQPQEGEPPGEPKSPQKMGGVTTETRDNDFKEEDHPRDEEGRFSSGNNSTNTSPTGGDIVGHLDKDGKIVRYNKRMHEFASGTIENGIKTYFVVDKKLQSNYYEKQKKEDLKNGGTL